MKSLFQRIFLTFWIGLTLILVLGVTATMAVSALRFDDLDDVSVTALVHEAREAAGAGRPRLIEWVQRTESLHPTIKVFLFDRHGEELRDRTIPIRERIWVAAYLRGEDSAKALAAAPGPAEAWTTSDTWWDVSLVPIADEAPRFLMFIPYDASVFEVLGVAYVPVLLLLCALLVSAPVCWVMARYISGPILKVQSGLRRLADGQLDTRMDGAFARRGDELGALAADFDKTAGRLQELADSREALLRDVSHELRSPLARLRVALDLARRRDATQPGQLDRIERECRRLDALIGQVLRLARLRTRVPAEQGWVDLAELVSATLADVDYEAAAAGKSIERRGSAPSVRLWGVHDELASMLENVARNALRFSPPGGVVRVALRAGSEQAEIRVLDRGPGVAPEHLGRVFDPFFRAAASPAHGHAGAGIGLAIAQEVAVRHGGAITASNRDGGGLCVRIVLPARAAPAH